MLKNMQPYTEESNNFWMPFWDIFWVFFCIYHVGLEKGAVKLEAINVVIVGWVIV